MVFPSKFGRVFHVNFGVPIACVIFHIVQRPSKVGINILFPTSGIRARLIRYLVTVHETDFYTIFLVYSAVLLNCHFCDGN